MLIENLKEKVVVIDNAFLKGDLEHEIYMKIPEGYDEVISKDVDKEDCLFFQKQFMDWFKKQDNSGRKIVDKMQGGRFQLNEADPCMLYKEDKKGFVSL